MRDIRAICGKCRAATDGSLTDELCVLTTDDDERVVYNALWTLTHLWKDGDDRLTAMRDTLIDHLLHTQHTGIRRLTLSLLQRTPADGDATRTDYLDFCLGGINSTEPYGVRALCMRQAFEMCRFYPELTQELLAELDMMNLGVMSPGLAAARKSVLAAIKRDGHAPPRT